MSALEKLNYIDGRLALSLLITLALGFTCQANAGTNNFFGANAGGSGANSQSNNADVDENNINAGLPGLTTPPAVPPTGDYTDDEKRMQHKYKGNIGRAKQLIDRGESMMKSSGKESKEYKKGKILKETGEKWLVELKSNDPFASEKAKSVSKDASTKESGSKESETKNNAKKKD